MKKLLTISLIVISLFLASCAVLRPTDESMLRAELRKWESFSGDGVIELSAYGFNLRKPFTVAKSANQMRLDVIEGGIFGAGASPLISMYLGGYSSILAPAMPILETLDLKDKIPLGTLALFSSADFLFEKYGAEIIREKAIVRDSMSINFTPKYQLDSVVDRKSGARVNVSYTNRGALDKMEIKVGRNVTARLLFDDVKYQVPNILPLPKGTGTQQNIMDLLKDEGLFKMFKGLLGD